MEALLAWIYPNRLLVAAIAAIAGVVLAIVGWRLGWHRVAARHRLLTAAAVLVAFVIAVPATWYFASPLVIRTELIETPPPVAAAPSATPSASVASSVLVEPTKKPTPTPTPLMLMGKFVGADDFHFAHGTARVVEPEPGTFVLRLENFSVRNGPDLYVYLSPDGKGYVRGSVELGRLKATDGSFNYGVPPGVAADMLGSVVIWCKAFSVQFGHAALS